MKKIALVLGICILLCNCAKKTKNYINFSGFAQGTTYSISYESEDNINYFDEIENILAEFDSSLSVYNKASLISKINRNESYNTDKYFRVVFKKAKEIYKISNGAFDITVAPLVNLWGFGLTERGKTTNAQIDSILKFTGLNKIDLKDTLIIKSDPRIMLDVNAIAQGYSVDIIAEFLEKKGVENYLVEIGGEVKTKGVNSKGKEWKIGIDKPFDNNFVPGENLQAIVTLSDKSLATSGNYRKFYEENGIKYSHTINPKNGYPVNHTLLSTTVIANDCITADAYATVFMVMGLEKSCKLVEQLPGIEAYFIYNDEKGKFQIKSTPAIQELIEDVK